MIEPHNDFVIPGTLRSEPSGKRKGPISRFACRIECERLPPYRCFVYAGGFAMENGKYDTVSFMIIIISVGFYIGSMHVLANIVVQNYKLNNI